MNGFVHHWSASVTGVLLAATIVVLTARAMVLAPSPRTTRMLDVTGAVGGLMVVVLVGLRFMVLS